MSKKTLNLWSVVRSPNLPDVELWRDRDETYSIVHHHTIDPGYHDPNWVVTQLATGLRCPYFDAPSALAEVSRLSGQEARFRTEVDPRPRETTMPNSDHLSPSARVEQSVWDTCERFSDMIHPDFIKTLADGVSLAAGTELHAIIERAEKAERQRDALLRDIDHSDLVMKLQSQLHETREELFKEQAKNIRAEAKPP